MSGVLKTTLIILLKILLVATCLALALHGTDWEQLRQAVLRFAPVRLAVALAASTLGAMAPALRWRFLLGGAASNTTCVRAQMLCTGLNAMLPAKAGEAAKIARLYQATGRAVGDLMALVIWEHFFDLNMLLLISLYSASAQGKTELVLALAPLVAVLWLCLLLNRLRPGLFPRLSALLPSAALKRWYLEALPVLRIHLHPRFLATLGTMTFLAWVAYGLSVVLTMCWAMELPITPQQAVIYFLFTASAMAVPATPGGAGLYEIIAVTCLDWFGVPRSTAAAAAIVSHVLILAPSMVWALLEILFGRLKTAAK